jgi:hypothetical protein
MPVVITIPAAVSAYFPFWDHHGFRLLASDWEGSGGQREVKAGKASTELCSTKQSEPKEEKKKSIDLAKIPFP